MEPTRSHGQTLLSDAFASLILSNPAVNIPSELVDTIIDGLHDHPQTLATLSLVGKSWLPRSRYHLFGLVRLHQRNMGQFLDLLRSSLCTFTTAIHYLEIVEETTSASWVSVMRSLSDLVAVQSLCIRDVSWKNFCEEARRIFLSSFKFLKNLEIVAVGFQSFADVIDILCAFPLETLILHDIPWDDPCFPYTQRHRLSNLKVLHLARCYKRDILDWLLSHDDIRAVKSIDLGWVSQQDSPAISRYLRVLGTSLENLRFGFTEMDAGGDAEGFYNDVDLGYNAKLRQVRIDGLIDEFSEIQFSSAVPWIPQIISRITSPHLEEVSFSVQLASVDELNPNDRHVDWSVFDQLFMETQFFHLLRLRFWVYGDVGAGDVENMIRKRLPKCDARGILYFS